MKTLLRLEELLMFALALALFLFSGLDFSWGLFALLFFAPDLSMIGYLKNPRLGAWILRPAQGGAWTYNLVHHKGLGITLYAVGVLLSTPWLTFTGILLFTHSSFDHILGYGLKHEDVFQNTHLGRIGK